MKCSFRSYQTEINYTRNNTALQNSCYILSFVLLHSNVVMLILIIKNTERLIDFSGKNLHLSLLIYQPNYLFMIFKSKVRLDEAFEKKNIWKL